VSKNTVQKLTLELGEARVAFQYCEMVNLPCTSIQADEVWATMRRFTRLSMGYSKSVTHMIAALAISFQVYNFLKPHSTLSKKFGRLTTPAMTAGLAVRHWTYERW
jgi:hypothetical protein